MTERRANELSDFARPFPFRQQDRIVSLGASLRMQNAFGLAGCAAGIEKPGNMLGIVVSWI